jgi:(1->4)-alpha-D-glucan 1-alpha-D-glucosylmutase
LLKNPDFVQSFAEFCSKLDRPAATNALAQTLLRLCVPGVPDTYQGGELWNQSLVDPDNRRPVDYELRRRYLREIVGRLDQRAALLGELLETYPDGRIKLFVIHVALQLRKREPELFAQGDYVPLEANEHVVAFARVFEEKRVLCVVPRLTRRLAGSTAFPLGSVWGSRAIAGLLPGRYRNLFTDEVFDVTGTLELARLFARFPLGLLVSETA